MARFRATAGSASRLGHAKGGISTTCRGWNGGVTVHCGAVHVSGVRKPTNYDEHLIYVDRGSSTRGGTKYIGKLVSGHDKWEFIPAGDNNES